MLNKFALLSKFQFSKKLFSFVFNFHLKITNQKGRHYKKIAIPTTLFFHFSQFYSIAIFSPQKLLKSIAKGLNFHFLKQLNHFIALFNNYLASNSKLTKRGDFTLGIFVHLHLKRQKHKPEFSYL